MLGKSNGWPALTTRTVQLFHWKSYSQVCYHCVRYIRFKKRLKKGGDSHVKGSNTYGLFMLLWNERPAQLNFLSIRNHCVVWCNKLNRYRLFTTSFRHLVTNVNFKVWQKNISTFTIVLVFLSPNGYFYRVNDRPCTVVIFPSLAPMLQCSSALQQRTRVYILKSTANLFKQKPKSRFKFKPFLFYYR